MKLKFFFVLALTVIIFVGCSPENRGEEVTILEIPATYQGWTNPQSGSEAISAGKLIYEVNCVACHGDTGLGDGPAGGSLVPAPVMYGCTSGMAVPGFSSAQMSTVRRQVISQAIRFPWRLLPSP